MEHCHFDICRQCLATAGVLSLLQDFRTRVQDFFPVFQPNARKSQSVTGRCRLVGGLDDSFGAASNLACSLKTIRSKRLFMRISLLDSRRMIAPMKNVLILMVTSTLFGVTCLRGDDKPLFAPRPTKDPMASKKQCQGTGIFEMVVDKPSGKVKEVFVRSSTKDLFLDADVINTFLQWRFKPNTQSSATIVVAFTADKDAASYPVGRTIHATNRGFPVPFTEPVAPAKLWQWFPERYGAAGHR